jgi:glutamate N-acetyltransferase/amino-acid N-acetyltransferase
MTLQQTIEKVRGFRVAGVHAGLKADGALDLALLVSDRPCVTAGVFTRNQMLGAPVIVTREHIQSHAQQMRAVVVNTKCANAATGRAGIENSRTMARMVAEHIACQPEQVVVMSTGVIGTHLPMPKIEKGIAQAYQSLGTDWLATADAIRTTDTHPKLASKTVYTSDGQYTIAGMVKGAGMIAPNMATMLTIIVTDAQIAQPDVAQALQEVNESTFNRIVVDGDTSPNDMVILMANGASGVALRTPTDLQQFKAGLYEVARHLAQAVVRDGEGAQKFITLHVMGASNKNDAHAIANTVATSPLVKTAFAGADANWGRIIAAAGRAPVDFNPDQARLWIRAGEAPAEEDEHGLLIFQKGMPAQFSEDEATAIMQADSVYVTLDCGHSDHSAIVWTCDLTHEYVSINADYRT